MFDCLIKSSCRKPNTSHQPASVTVKMTHSATRAMTKRLRLRSALICYSLSLWERVRVRALVLLTKRGKSLVVLLPVTSSLTPALSQREREITFLLLTVLLQELPCALAPKPQPYALEKRSSLH